MLRVAAMMAWPLRTSLACSSSPFRGGIYAGFHSLALHDRDVRWSQPQRVSRVRERHYDGLCAAGLGPRRLVVRRLNRIMLEPCEVSEGEEGRLSAKLPAVDARTAHVRGVLKIKDGEPLRIGVVDAGRLDNASIRWVEPVDPPDSAPPPDVRGRQNRVSSPKWMDLVLDLGPVDRQLLDPVPQEKRPKVALMLAVPRPLQLERILPVVASVGISTLILCQARKVPKFYFGSHYFRNPARTRAKLVEGLSQCGETVLPKVVVARRLKVFLEDDLDELFPRDRWVRAVAHPTRSPALVAPSARDTGTTPATAEVREARVNRAGETRQSRGLGSDSADAILAPGLQFSQLEPPKGCDPADAGILVAVGPEGGWEEPGEVQLLESFGFQAVTLGSRVLRSDVAVISLLTLAHAWVNERAVKHPSVPEEEATASPTPEQ